MSNYLRIALRLYTQLSIVFVVGYVIYIIYDDYVLFQDIDSFSDLGIPILFGLIYLAIYFLAFTFCYIGIALVVILGAIALRKFGLKNE